MKRYDTSDTVSVNTMSRVFIHSVQFYELKTRSIKAMAYNNALRKLALSRNDGVIELWDMRFVPCLDITFPTNDFVECLAWCGERLFSGGNNGDLVEWDLVTLRYRRNHQISSKTIWCMDVNRAGTDLAVGTDSGQICVCSLEEVLQEKFLLTLNDNRVLCCRFDSSGNVLVTGSVGIISIWNATVGSIMKTIDLCRDKKNKQIPIIWSLQVLSDLTIITGDSCGALTIWDGENAVQVEKHEVLKADVLTVAVNEKEDKIICAGVEPIIRIFSKVEIKREEMMYSRWIKYLQRRIHYHDVKALICDRDSFYSGGVDGYLGVASVLKNNGTIQRYGPFLQQPNSAVSSEQRLLLLRYPNTLEVWRTGTAYDKETKFGKFDTKSMNDNALKLKNVPEKILCLRSKYDEYITCSALAPNGNWLCYSNMDSIRFYRFQAGIFDDNTKKISTELIPVKKLPKEFEPTSHMCFIANPLRLFIVNSQTEQIRIFSIDDIEYNNNSITEKILNFASPLQFINYINIAKKNMRQIKFLHISESGIYVVIANITGLIAVWILEDNDDKKYKYLCTLPRFNASITAIVVNEKTCTLVAASSNNHIIEYDLIKMHICTFDQNRFMIDSDYYTINNICLHPHEPNVFIMQIDTDMFVLKKTYDNFEEFVKKTKSTDESIRKTCKLSLTYEKHFQHIIHMCWLTDNEIVLICIDPDNIIRNLPSVFKEKLFRAT